MQQQHEVTQRRQRLIANCPTTGMNSQICVTKAVTIVLLSGQQMGDCCQRTQRAALDMCVASSIAAAARGGAAQAAFDRELTHYRNEFGELRQQSIHCRPRKSGQWMGGPHPAVTRTLQCAADIASSRNGQQMSAKSLQSRWKHEIQIALLRRRAAMTRAVLPNPSARAEWLFAGIIDRAVHYWDRVPPLDGGIGDHDHADSETDTAIPDDDDDIASQPSASLQPSSF